MSGIRRRFLGTLALAVALTAAATPDHPVADAAMRGDLDAVREVLRGGADVNDAQGDGMTALHWAAERGDLAIVEVLLHAGAGVESRTRIGGFTPLLVASRRGRGDVVRRLLEAGADLGASTSTGEAALHLAAAAGSVASVSALLEGGADVDPVEGAHGQTPLMYAAAYGRTAAIRTLLARGADPALRTRVVDYVAMALEDQALAEVREERLETLFGQGNGAGRPVDGTEADDDDEADEEPLRKPLSYDELVGKQGGLGALHYAAREGHREAADALLEGGADVNQLSGGDRTSPLLMATLNGHFDLAMDLLDRGADPSLASVPGTAPLYAVINLEWVPKSFYPQPRASARQTTGYLELMEALLRAGADPDARLERHPWYTSFNHNVLGVDMWGATAFWRAAYGTDIDAMRLLVRYGANPLLPTRRPPDRSYGPSTGNGEEDGEADPSGLPPVPVGGPGVFPIHAASGAGYGHGLAGNAHRHAPDGWLPSVRYLVDELGADPDLRDYHGFTPLHNAAARGDQALILYLVSVGADVTALTRKGQTTADMANGPVQRVTVFPDVVALLERLGSGNSHNCVSC